MFDDVTAALAAAEGDLSKPTIDLPAAWLQVTFA